MYKGSKFFPLREDGIALVYKKAESHRNYLLYKKWQKLYQVHQVRLIIPNNSEALCVIHPDKASEICQISVLYQQKFDNRCLKLITFYFFNPYSPRKSASENVVCLCRLLHLLANFSNLDFAYRQTVWTQIRLLLRSSLIWVHTVCNNDF